MCVTSTEPPYVGQLRKVVAKRNAAQLVLRLEPFISLVFTAGAPHRLVIHRLEHVLNNLLRCRLKGALVQRPGQAELGEWGRRVA